MISDPTPDERTGQKYTVTLKPKRRTRPQCRGPPFNDRAALKRSHTELVGLMKTIGLTLKTKENTMPKGIKRESKFVPSKEYIDKSVEEFLESGRTITKLGFKGDEEKFISTTDLPSEVDELLMGE